MDLNNLINKIGIKQKEENKALDAYVENSNQNNEKLETLLSEFKEIITDGAAPRLYIDGDVDEYYNYINKKINDFEFDGKNLNLLLSNLPLYQMLDGKNLNLLLSNLPLYQINDIIINNDENTRFGLFLSALINKNVKAGEKVQITIPIPINRLFYKLKDSEAHVNIAGEYLGDFAKNSKIYAGEARDYTGYNMKGCELHVRKTGNRLGSGATNSRIYADEAGEWAGWGMEGCELYVRKADYCLGTRAKNSRVYADEAGDFAGPFMQNSQLFIYDLKGNLAGNVLKGNNTIYLGKESYEKFPEYHGKVEIWEKTI
jgi:hypothetical protein